MTPSPVALVAQSAGLRTVKRDSLRNDGELFAGLDVVVVVAYGAMVPADLLAVPALGWINVHYSMLPRWRGAAPVQHAILNGDHATGVCVFQLEPTLDTGPIFIASEHPLRGDETAGSLMQDLTDLGCTALIDTLTLMESREARATEQSQNGITYASKIATTDARINWMSSARDIDQLVRAMTPHPGAWTMNGDERLKVSPVRVYDRHNLDPGSCVREGNLILVGTGDGAVALTQVQRAGRTVVDASSWYLPDTVLV
jgi:methionyl-tRNA formyltransferase